MRFSLRVRQGRASTTEFGQRLGEAITAAGGEVVTEGESADLVLAVGGDGTMLHAVQDALAGEVPVLGFNLGTLGFLAAADAQDLHEVVGRLVSGDYEVTPRMTVRARIGDREAVGINDVVVEKIDTTRLVNLEVFVDGERFTTYRADGLILATPTGSTAYSFSAGGPLVDPGVDALVMTPVATHSLFDRALVLPGGAEIDVSVSVDRAVRVNVDKTDLGVLGGEMLRVGKGQAPALFVDFGDRPFPGLVRDKFGLG